MAAAQGLYAETISDLITMDVSEGWEKAANIPLTSFSSLDKYLIIANAYIASSSATIEFRARLAHGVDGLETAFTDGDYRIEVQGGGSGWNCTWMYVFDQPAVAEQIKIEFGSTGADDVTCHMSQLFCLNLSDLTTDDWKYNEATTDYTNTTTLADAGASVTFTPNGTDTWMLVGHFVQNVNDATFQQEARINDSVVGALEPLWSVEGEDATNETAKDGMMMTSYVPSNAAHTVTVQSRNEGGTANTILSNRIFALRLNAFDQFFAEGTAAELSLTASFQTAEAATITPNVTGDWFYLGQAVHDAASTVNEIRMRLQDDNGGSLASDPNYGDDRIGVWSYDATDETPVFIFKMKSLTSGGARTVNLDVQAQASAGVAEDRNLVGFSLELATVGGAFIPLDDFGINGIFGI